MSQNNGIVRRAPLYALFFMLLLVAADLGLILGSIFAAALLPAFYALVGSGATLAAIVIAALIYRRIRR